MQRLREFYFSYDTFSATVFTIACRALSESETVQEQGIPPLENFDVPNSRICDVRVHARRPVPRWPGARAAGNRLWLMRITVSSR